MNAPVHTVYVRSLAALTRFDDLDVVSLVADVTDDLGRLIPAGSRGTIVASFAEGAAYEVDFVDPFGTNATVEAEKLVLSEAA